jgi:hypothetical protein
MSNTPKKPATQKHGDATKPQTRTNHPAQPTALEAEADTEPTPLGNLAGVSEFQEFAPLCRIRVPEAR